MIASKLILTRSDIKALSVTDAYSLHRIVYDLFDDVRSESQKKASVSSGILYADKGGDWNNRQILILSNRPPKNPIHGYVDSKKIPETFLQYDHYGFEITINPTKRDKATGKIVAIIGREQIMKWYIDKAQKSWGFAVKPRSLQVQSINVKTFDKKGHHVTQSCATLIGELTVTERSKFTQSFQQGIGRGRAFGCGLLQIIPLSNLFNL